MRAVELSTAAVRPHARSNKKRDRNGLFQSKKSKDDSHAVQQNPSSSAMNLVTELRDRGWLILEAATGETALDKFGTAYFDVLFTDDRPGGEQSGWNFGRSCLPWPTRQRIFPSRAE